MRTSCIVTFELFPSATHHLVHEPERQEKRARDRNQFAFRDLFDATFFFFFGLRVDPATLPPVLLFAVLLGIVTSLTNVLTGYWAGRRAGIERRGALRAGMALVSRGEFSIVIAGLGAAVEPQLEPRQLPKYCC
jgi:Kef-type K+ transport system membrane component KefB